MRRMKWLEGITDSMDMSVSSLTESVTGILTVLQSRGHKASRTNQATELTAPNLSSSRQDLVPCPGITTWDPAGLGVLATGPPEVP